MRPSHIQPNCSFEIHILKQITSKHILEERFALVQEKSNKLAKFACANNIVVKVTQLHLFALKIFRILDASLQQTGVEYHKCVRKSLL